MSNGNYYKEIAVGAGTAAGVSATIGILERLIVYYATPGNCTEIKEFFKNRVDPENGKSLVWK